MAEPARFLAPGAGSIEAAAPGRYVIWHEHRTTFENRVYRSPAGLPAGARFTVRGPGGPPLPVGPAESMSWKDGEVERQAVGSFEAPVAGRYVIVLDGAFPSLVIAVLPDYLGRVVLLAGGAVLLALFGIGAGIGLFAWALGADEPGGWKPATKASPAPAPAEAHKELRDMVTLVYALQAASIVVGVTLIGGVVIDYLKRDEAAGTWLESHIRWQIRTFWWTIVWSVLGFVLAIVLVGFLIWIAAAVWFVYRVAKGWVELRAGRPVGV